MKWWPRLWRRANRIWLFPALFVLAALQVSCKPAVPTRLPDPKHVKDLRRSGKYDAALAEAQQGMERSSPSLPEYWAFLIEKADLLYGRNGSKAARPLLEQEPPSGPQFASQRAHRKLLQGWVEYTDGKNAAAEQLWDQGLEIATAANDHEMIAGLEFSEAQMFSTLSRIPEADQRMRDADRQAEAAHDPFLTSYGLNTLSVWLIGQSQFEEALPVLEREYATTDSKVGDNAFRALSNMGWCLYRLGEYDRSLAVLRKVEEIGSREGAAKIPDSVFGNLGNIYKQREDYATARGYYLKALQISEQRGEKRLAGKWLGNLANISIQLKDWAGAETYNSQALAIAKDLGDRTAQLHSKCNSAQILNGRGDPAGAIRLFEEVSRTETNDRVPALQAHNLLARLYSDRGQDALADRQYRAALDIVEDRRSSLKQDEFKLSFLSALITVHQDYVDFLMSHGRNQRALEVAEASRARILQERLGDRERTPAFSAATYQRLARDSGSVLLSYSLGRERSYVWVTTATGIVSYPLPSEERIRSLVEKYRAFIENMHDPLDTEDTSGPELYQAVLAPVQPRLPPGARIVIAPDLGLHALNFETLVVPTPRKHYFLEDATITVAPSLNLLIGHLPAHSSSAKLLLIGDPNSTDEHFPKLPYAAKEIALVEGHFPSAEVTGYREAAAVPAAYETSPLNGFSYIHFTAHATANREFPLDSAIVLSGANGKLTAREVLQHPLSAELVTISACRGAGAKTYGGEGLVGFMWAFFQSGARNIIAGLWDVSDESTPQLMDSLYAGIMQGQPPAQALRAAKLALIKTRVTWSRPYYWAPFQLYSREIPPPTRD